MQIKQEKGHYTLYKESEAIGTAVVDGAAILRLEIVPAWRGRGYGSYLVKELLRRGGGLNPKQATRFTAPLPRDEAGRALARLIRPTLRAGFQQIVWGAFRFCGGAPFYFSCKIGFQRVQ